MRALTNGKAAHKATDIRDGNRARAADGLPERNQLIGGSQMIKSAGIALLFALLLLAAPAALGKRDVILDSIDLGSAGTEAGREMWGWGRSGTDETGGGYGGIGPGGCRLVWDIAQNPDDGPDAMVTLVPDQGAAKGLLLRHLDGLADDSFDLYVEHSNGSWSYAGHYQDQYDAEQWVESFFDISHVKLGRGHAFQLEIVATGEPWSGFDTWGQLCIDWVGLQGNGSGK
jgi:hypothetical protein